MPASHVQVQPDGTGKDIDADSVTSTEAGTPTVYRQNIIAADPVTYASKVRVFAPGEQRVALDASQLFIDTFDASLDTVNRWAAPVATGTGAVAATWSAGQILLTGGTALNAYSELHSQPVFDPEEPGWLQVVYRINIEFPVLTTAYRFWGIGQTTSTPTIAAPLTDAVGWEVSTGGAFAAVTYASGTRTQVASITAPGDALAHKYYLYFRGDQSYWAVDDPDKIAASFLTGASGPNVNSLPLKILAISDSGTAATVQVNGVSVGDTSRSSTTLSDGTYAWRQAMITAGGAVSVSANASRTQMAFGTAAAGVSAGSTTVDALIVLAQQFRAGVSAGTTGTSYAITAGKTFRVTSMTVAYLNPSGVVGTAVVTLRYNPTGAVTTASAPAAVVTLSVPAVASQADRQTIAFPDGLDLPGGTTPGQFGIDVLPTFASGSPLIGAWLSGYEW